MAFIQGGATDSRGRFFPTKKALKDALAAGPEQVMFYATSPMVRVRKSPALPTIQHIVRSNFCDIGFEVSPDGKRLVIVSCLDNLLKGAAGQAVQNMNVMCGFKEEEGLL